MESPEKRASSPYNEARQRLASHVSDLETAVSHLRERVDPLLGPSEPRAESVDQPSAVAAPTSAVVADLDETSRRLDSLSGLVQEMLRRLEV